MPSSTSISADEVCRAPRGHVITGGGLGFGMLHAGCGTGWSQGRAVYAACAGWVGGGRVSAG